MNLQTIIALLLIGVALFLAVRSLIRSTKKIAATNPCGGCGSSCDGCAIKNSGIKSPGSPERRAAPKS